MRLRDKRESNALKFLSQEGKAFALDLGTAAVAGEPTRRFSHRETLGLQIGLRFVRRGFARIDEFNRFMWVPPK
jgi:hypothetical protein